MSKRLKNLFYKIAKDENSTTELLCNLMNFRLFREKFLDIFLSRELTDGISFDDFDTQVSLNEAGKPDLVVENENVKIVIEVKTGKRTNLTENQPSGYYHHLLKQDIENKWLIFIVPEGYVHKNQIEETLTSLDSEHPSNEIGRQLIYWEDIIRIIEFNELNKISQILSEFYNLLKAWYIPEQIQFNYSEIQTMFSSAIPKTLSKLAQIVNEINVRAGDYNPWLYRQKSFPPSEYGIYFYSKDGVGLLFFGLWFSVWQEKQLPICFGVQNSYSEEVKSVFEKHYDGKIIEYSDWKLSWIDDSVFSQDDCIDVIWDTLEAFLSQVKTVVKST